jgi:tRNA-dihydrouridine synthase B
MYIQYLRPGVGPPAPPLAEQLAILLGHYRDMLSHYGVHAGVRIARKHIGWYSKGLEGGAELRAAINRMDDPAAVEERIRAFYAPRIGAKAA